jgi:hypothetical protein
MSLQALCKQSATLMEKLHKWRIVASKTSLVPTPSSANVGAWQWFASAGEPDLLEVVAVSC